MGPIEAGFSIAAQQRKERLGARPPPLRAPWRPVVLPAPPPIVKAAPPASIEPEDLAHSPYGPPIPCANVERVKWNIDKHIIRIVAHLWDVGVRDIISERRTKDVIIPRHVAMYFCKKLTPHSLPRIGKSFGGRDHTTVLSAVRKIQRIIDAGEEQHMRLIAKIYEAETIIRSRIVAASHL